MRNRIECDDASCVDSCFEISKLGKIQFPLKNLPVSMFIAK